MKDRIPTYPGRVKLTPVSGQTNVYDLERMDAPTEAGTPLSKASLLTDMTAASMGLSGDVATVNDALAALLGIAAAGKMTADYERLCDGTYLGGGAGGVSITFPAPPKVVLVFDIRGGVVAPLAIMTPDGGFMFMSTATNGNAAVSGCTVNGNTLSWSGTGSAAMNQSGITYHYLALLDAPKDYIQLTLDGSEDEDWVTMATSPTGNYRMRYNNTEIPCYGDYDLASTSSDGQPAAAYGIIRSNQFAEGWIKNSSLNNHPYYKHQTIMLHQTNHLIQLYHPTYQTVEAWRAYLAAHPLRVLIKKPTAAE